jgi:tripartite-type tricarboxylate transporter receptor subunit TctC
MPSFWKTCFAAMLIGLAHAAAAQSYPSQPIRLVVPFAPGGGSDIIARILSEPMARQLGQPIVIDNKPGAGATLGADIVAKSRPDGYTLLYTTIGPQITNPFLMKQLPYDPVNDLAPVAMLAELVNVLVVHPSVPARNVRELIEYAKANPGKLNFSSSGVGTSSHLGGELFKSLAGIDIQHIAYKGTGPSLQDLQSGNVQMALDSLATLLPFIKSGRLVALGISSVERNPLLPDAPAIADSLPGYEASTVNYFTARSGTPRPIIDRLNRDIAVVLRIPEIRERLLGLGVVPTVESPEVLGARIIRESAKWKKVIEHSGAKID